MPTSHTSVRDSPDLTALHAVLAFLVTVLINLVQVKYQGKPTSPFDTHPFATTLTVFCLLFYCSLALVAHLSFAPACHARAFPILMILTALLWVASFMSLLFRRPFHSFPYLLSLVLLSMVLLSVFVHGFRPSRPADQPLLPQTVMDVQLVQVDPAPDGLQGAHHQRTPRNDSRVCNRGPSDSSSSMATSDGGPIAVLQPCVAVLSPNSASTTLPVVTADGDREARLEMAGHGGKV